MNSTSQHLFMSDLLHHNDDAVHPDGPNDIDVSQTVTNGQLNNNFTIGSSPDLQRRIRNILTEYDIFSYNSKAESEPPMTVTVNRVGSSSKSVTFSKHLCGKPCCVE